jgi:DNA-binding MarR family transcriptional regulator
MAGEIKNENYVVVQGWMINDLNIKGNELIVYAIIYGFSQTEGQVFNGSLQYLANWTRSTKQGVSKNLKSLVEKGYIVKNDKYINGVKFCEYYTTKFNGVYNKVEQGMQQSLIPPMQQSLTNNTNINNTNNNTNNKKENKKEKNYLSPLGEFKNVLLTQEELDKLKTNISNYQEKIEDLSIYLENNPKKKYASHYATILNWYRKEQKNVSNASNTYKRQEIVPEWMNKEIQGNKPTAAEQKEMEDILKQYEDEDFEARKKALQEKLKNKYGK